VRTNRSTVTASEVCRTSWISEDGDAVVLEQRLDTGGQCAVAGWRGSRPSSAPYRRAKTRPASGIGQGASGDSVSIFAQPLTGFGFGRKLRGGGGGGGGGGVGGGGGRGGGGARRRTPSAHV